MYGAVHPHGRGDNRCQELVETAQHGSPPRAWGQCPYHPRAPDGCRFTPTGVGTICTWARRHQTLAVHPHGRGDNARTTRERQTDAGSPPQAWGQCARPRPHHPARRFTPTGVGTINRTITHHATHAVHPHRRGDNLSIVNAGEDRNGSPPQAWGQLNWSEVADEDVRFTPTGVGTMADGLGARGYWSVHPHRRGDNAVFAYFTWAQVGSPPQAWGQWYGVRACYRATRFTPTGVGTMVGFFAHCRRGAVHPHRRGDNCSAASTTRSANGSPPQAWGQSRNRVTA